MATVTVSGKAVKRTCRVMFGTTMLVMTFDDGVEAVADAYDLREIGSQCGRGFRLTKILEAGEGLDARRQRGQTYECHVAGNGQQSCTCPAGRWRGLCRHASSLRRLIDTGRISGGYPG